MLEERLHELTSCVKPPIGATLRYRPPRAVNVGWESPDHYEAWRKLTQRIHDEMQWRSRRAPHS
jgi:hypothetical protein